MVAGVVALAKSGPMSETTADKPQAVPRSAYRVFRTIGTRWMDNDGYGPINNVVYDSWFDTAARGHFVHVDGDRASRRPVPLPAKLKSILETLQ